jgi:hypothetical protein
VSEADGFIHLSQTAVERLQAERFDFQSQAGADLLARVVSNRDSHDNTAMLRLIELGAPVIGANDPPWSFTGEYRSLLDSVLIGQRTELIEPLLRRGVLETHGAPDQSKIDAAFQAAVTGARLEPVERIWSMAGASAHPALTFEDSYDGRVEKNVPVALLLRQRVSEQGVWEGLAITKWLVARGCDIKGVGANGDTLLHVAVDADDVELVRYLLNQGFDASTPGRYAMLALENTGNEDVALLLLKAGTDLSKLTQSRQDFRKDAERNRWSRVLAWLDAH